MNMELLRIFSIYITIDLSCNRFEGNIPSVIGDLTSLVMLNLSDNSLEGNIPTSLGSVSALQLLYLSFNKLSGEIPVQRLSLTFLGFLSVSTIILLGASPVETSLLHLKAVHMKRMMNCEAFQIQKIVVIVVMYHNQSLHQH